MTTHYYVIGLIAIVMLFLALQDWVSPSANRRSIIVSLGVLGTFLASAMVCIISMSLN